MLESEVEALITVGCRRWAVLKFPACWQKCTVGSRKAVLLLITRDHAKGFR